MATVDAPTAGGDSSELAGFGYKQELDRSLGKFSSFAAGFSYISILTGVFQLFGFGFAFAGPAVWWSWLVVLAGQGCVALCFAELAGQFPLAGSVYQWSKRIGTDFVSWMTGWILIIGSIVTVSAVAVAWQVVLPQITSKLQFVGSASNAGLYNTPDGAKNALILGAILVIIATVVNMLGVKVMARLNNIGVMAELIGCSILVILMIFHFHRGPGVVTHSLGTGAGHSWGYFGAFLIGGIMSAYVMYGFDTAGTLAEETHDPRRAAPPAILRALAAAALLGGLLILFALMDVKNISDKNISLAGLPYIVKQALGNTVGNVFLADAGLAILVCTLAVCTACIRMLFSMARDGRLPGGSSLARVSGRARVPIVPALFVGFCALLILLVNLANQSAFVTLTSVAIVMFYLPYLAVTGSMLYRRMNGGWPRPDHGPYFSLGRWGFAVNLFAVVYGTVVAFNIAWPRKDVYGTKWYFQFGAYEFIGASFLVGCAYYFLVQRHKADSVLSEHRAEVPTLPGEHIPLGEAAP
ncbi:MAG TPA: amino acid permease [Solirubrobacteraceae bacterium]|jgi:urea carboxylase system permease|nr:amino acid permease [Solirubrobacteraceae bacterium]